MAGLAVALIAEEAAGVKTLQLLDDRRHRVVAVFTRSPGPVAGRAKSLGVTVRDAEDVRSPVTGDRLRRQHVQLLLNVHSLYIVDDDVLEAPPLGAYNLHPGPLPERAGLHTPSWAIYEGSEFHGVTLHRMTSDVDAGAIAFADRFAIGPEDTGLSVLTRCVNRGVGLIAQLLDCAECGDPIPAHEQDLSRRRWFAAGPPQGGHLDWDRPAREVVAFVRACDYAPFESPWGRPRCTTGEIEVAILKARALEAPSASAPGTVVHADARAVRVAAADAWVRVDTVEIAGETIAPADAIPAGARLE